MTHPVGISVVLMAAITFVVMLILLVANIYGRYLRVSRSKGALVMLACFIGSVVLGYFRVNQFEGHGLEDKDVLSICFASLLAWAAIPFLAKLYLTWIAGAVTDAEKTPGIEGIRAWLRGGNLLCVVLISFCLWLGFGYSSWMPLVLMLMALLAFPVLNLAMDTTTPQTSPAAGDSLSPERERVLKMLDDGKITAQESAELLNALGHSAQARAPQSAPPAPHRKMVWVGAALLIVGFFFPWFVIKTGDAQEAMNNMNNMMRQMPGIQGMPMPNISGMLPQGMTISVAAGDIAHGLGWCVLLLGIAAAVLPFVAANLDSQTCQKISLIVLGAGAIILIYLLTQDIRFASIGILLALAGYALEFAGVVKARRLDWVGR